MMIDLSTLEQSAAASPWMSVRTAETATGALVVLATFLFGLLVVNIALYAGTLWRGRR